MRRGVGEHDQDGFCESTLNFAKYLVPSNPSEMEEDSFIDNQVSGANLHLLLLAVAFQNIHLRHVPNS